MYQQRVHVHFVDGTVEEVVLTQWSMSQFAQWASRQGIKFDTDAPGLLGVTMMRFQAFAELHRDPTKPRATFEKWDATVAEVDPQEDADVVDPTQPEASGG